MSAERPPTPTTQSPASAVRVRLLGAVVALAAGVAAVIIAVELARSVLG
jgi:hypothetical protein